MAENQPLIWCLLGRKAGDNTQVLALAEELGWPCEQKSIHARPWELLMHIGSGVTLAGIDCHRSSPLEAPWPDLLISAGRRNEPVARWIAAASGGKTRILQMGRPWAPVDCWDLIVTTPQYFLPRADNVQHNELPLHRLCRADLEEEAASLESQLQHLPRPWTVLLVGGDSGRFVFTACKGRALGEACNRLVGERGGSLLVTNSPRTPQDTYDALLDAVDVPLYSYRWVRGASDNPYRGLLALADRFVVTGESMSMLAEASAMGLPLYIYDMGDGETPWWQLPHSYRYKPLSYHLAMAIGPTRMRRDVGRIQETLVERGHAAWLGEAEPEGVAVSRGELAATADRVRQLFGLSG